MRRQLYTFAAKDQRDSSRHLEQHILSICYSTVLNPVCLLLNKPTSTAAIHISRMTFRIKSQHFFCDNLVSDLMAQYPITERTAASEMGRMTCCVRLESLHWWWDVLIQPAGWKNTPRSGLILTMISTDVYPPSALHHAGPLQDIMVGLPLHLMLEGAHLTLCFSICQVPCGAEQEKQHLRKPFFWTAL